MFLLFQTLFCEKLSQKIRNMRFQRRRKSGEDCSRSPKLPKFSSRPTCTISEVSEEDYNKHINEIKEEMSKPRPNVEHIRLLLKETHANRRSWLSTQPPGSWAPLLKAFPCFKDIDQVMGSNLFYYYYFI